MFHGHLWRPYFVKLNGVCMILIIYVLWFIYILKAETFMQILRCLAEHKVFSGHGNYFKILFRVAAR